MDNYLKPYKWTFLNKNIEVSLAGRQQNGNFKITNGISKPRHVFVFMANAANFNAQTVNAFLYNTFSVPWWSLSNLSISTVLWKWGKPNWSRGKKNSKGKGLLLGKIGKECGIVNLDDIQGPGTHWVWYRNLDDNFVEYFDPFGLLMPQEIYHYLASSGKRLIYSQDELQNRDSVLCGYWCLYYLNERQKGSRSWKLFTINILTQIIEIS